MNGKPMDLSNHVIKTTEKEEDKIPQLGVADLFDSELWMMTVSMVMMTVGRVMMTVGRVMMTVGRVMMMGMGMGRALSDFDGDLQVAFIDCTCVIF